MNRKIKIACIAFVLLAVTLVGVSFLQSNNLLVLHPAGTIAAKQRNLLAFTAVLSLLIVLPVFALTFGIAWRYRASNTKATYMPDWSHNFKLELLWWGIPFVIILLLAAVTWNSSHDLDPHKPLAAHTIQDKPLTIQVIALQWKWLFIYPEQGIAAVNLVQFPQKTPIRFELTADAPMNSFWIPRLGGQIYAMPGMTTKLHLMADQTGSYSGSSANLSGEGFANMKFTALSRTQADFDAWTRVAQQSPTLDVSTYNLVAQPTKTNPVAYYRLGDHTLYDKVVMKYMKPAHEKSGPGDMNMRGTEHDASHHR